MTDTFISTTTSASKQKPEWRRLCCATPHKSNNLTQGLFLCCTNKLGQCRSFKELSQHHTGSNAQRRDDARLRSTVEALCSRQQEQHRIYFAGAGHTGFFAAIPDTSPARYNKPCQYITAFFNWMVKQEYIPKNPITTNELKKSHDEGNLKPV